MTTGYRAYTMELIKRMLDIEVSRATFYSWEERGEIPNTVGRKENERRSWSIESVAEIGKKMTPLATPENNNSAVVISIYLSKGGGSTKTTFAHNFAKYLALHGKKVLLVPLDFQLNLSKKFGIDNSPDRVEKTGEFYMGLYEAITKQDTHINDVVIKTRFPNIDIIPESDNLITLEFWLNAQAFREKVFRKALQPLIKEYDVVIFDNNPSWDTIRLNSICASDFLIAPIGADSESSNTLSRFLQTLNKQLDGYAFKDLIFIPSLTESNVLKKEIVNEYRTKYPLLFTANDIRKCTRVDEANALNLSVFEYCPKHPVAEDYKKVCAEVWTRIVNNFKQKN
ncbi:MAG: ParA family protein [Oligoflexia bacterium]|nr:ParA family protein [Oligoflexia bacterium]